MCMDSALLFGLNLHLKYLRVMNALEWCLRLERLQQMFHCLDDFSQPDSLQCRVDL